MKEYLNSIVFFVNKREMMGSLCLVVSLFSYLLSIP